LKAFYYPPKVGYNIGTEDSPNSYMLEIHYDNPEGIEGQLVRLFIFSKLKAHFAVSTCSMFKIIMLFPSLRNDIICFGNG